MPRTNERVVNGFLVEQLRLQHPRWREQTNGRDNLAAEQTRALDGNPNLAADIVIRSSGGRPVVVETEYNPARTVEQDARSRLGYSIDGRKIEGALAVKIPEELGRRQTDLGVAINEQEYEYCLIHGTAFYNDRWPGQGWLRGGISDLATAIEHVAQAETINIAANILERGIEDGERLLRVNQTNHPQMLPEMARLLHQEDSVQTTRMAVAILANAFVFQNAIAGNHKIPIPSDLLEQEDVSLRTSVRRCWQQILAINYVSIFRFARELLVPIPDPVARPLLERMIELAGRMSELGTTSMHDLSGQMFQRLITDRKFLATFYTLPSSAALLANLAVSRLPIDWGNREAIANLRIADFACGTGSLISAAQKAVATNYRHEGGDDRKLHALLMEQVLIATDIMPSATHLTASTLSGVHPPICFGNTNIYTLPYGCENGDVRIGALDLILENEVRNLFGEGVAIRAGGRRETIEQTAVIDHGSCDLVIMNPPFVNPTNHEVAAVPVPSFAGFGTSAEEQTAMSSRLKQIRSTLMRRYNRAGGAQIYPIPAGDGRAGLASNFMDIAHAKLKPGGCLALVLPASFTQGAGSVKARQMITDFYDDVIIVAITSTGQTDRAFSADTGMAEILLIGTKRHQKRAENMQDDRNALTVNLVRRPINLLDGALLSKAIESTRLDDQERGEITLGNGVPHSGLFRRATLQTAFKLAGIKDEGLGNALINLEAGYLLHPQTNAMFQFPLALLGDLGERGVVHRKINGVGENGPFDILPLEQGEYPDYPTLWSHNAGQEQQFVVRPDRKGRPRPGCTERAAELWERTSSCLHFTLDFRLSSQPLAACFTEDRTIGGTAWPNFIVANPEWEKLILLWANTTLGLMTFWWTGTRQQQGRSRLTISRLPELLMLDARRLNEEQYALSENIFERFRERTFLPANEAYRDNTRQDLDRAVLTELLGLDEEVLEGLRILREQWCREPSVHGGKTTRPEEGN